MKDEPCGLNSLSFEPISKLKPSGPIFPSMSAPMSIAGGGVSATAHILSGASPAMAPGQKMSNLFDEIVPAGGTSITQGQFLQAFQTMSPPASFQAAGAGTVWRELDPSGTGSVSKPDFVNGMTTLMQQLRGGTIGAGSSTGAQSLAQSANQLEALGNAAGTGSWLNSVA